MCGFVGVVGKKVDHAIIKKMIFSIAHRGPDNISYFEDEDVHFGFCRLAINDLTEKSNQPFYNNKNILLFNGEIYNYRLLNKKFNLKSLDNSDTSTLFNLLSNNGKDILNQLNGMFSFLFYDRKSKSFFAARDRFGEKPFYYSYLPNGGIVFASELKAILNSGLIIPEIDTSQISNYLSFLHVDPANTIFKNIIPLQPGELISYENKRLKKEKYWVNSNYKITNQLDLNEKNLSEFKYKIKNTIHNSVKIQLDACVEVGVFLSGGLDSSIITAVASEYKSKIKTFSFGYESRSELGYSNLISKKFKTEHHHFFESNFKISDNLLEINKFFDQPFADSACIPFFILSKKARNFVKVCLGGDGADEIFCGYSNWYSRIEDYRSFTKNSHKVTNLIHKYLPQKYFKKAFLFKKFYDTKKITSNELEAYFYLKSVTNSSTLKKLGLNQIIINLPLTNNLPEFDNYINFDQKYYLPGDILFFKDMMTMANSLELRSPFLDKEILELNSQIPKNLHYHNNIGKFLLKETFKDKIPVEIINRKKQGFGAPIDKWLKNNDMIDLSSEYLLNKNKKIYNFIDHRGVKKIFYNNDYTKWALLNLSIWFERWYN